MTLQELFALRPGQTILGPGTETLNVTANTGTYICLDRPDGLGGINMAKGTKFAEWWANEATLVEDES